MILAQNWPKTAKSSWHCSFNKINERFSVCLSEQQDSQNESFHVVVEHPNRILIAYIIDNTLYVEHTVKHE